MNTQTQPFAERKIALPTLTGFVIVEIEEIIRCQSENICTTIFLKNKSKIVISRTIKQCEELLSNYGFARVHNSHLVNMNCISEYVRGKSGMLKLEDGQWIIVSRQRKEYFLSKLKRI